MDLVRRLKLAYFAHDRMRRTLKAAKKFHFDRRLTRRELRLNYQVRKQYQVRCISLGYDCLVRTILTNWMLKPDRRSGEKGMLFDRAKHSAKEIADLLEKDFTGYFENWRFDPAAEMQCWFNLSKVDSPDDFRFPATQEARSGVDYTFYFHDRDCGPDDHEKLQQRLKRRLESFVETLTHPRENDLYLLHKLPADAKEDVERMCRLIREKRGAVPTRILVFVTDHRDPLEKLENAVVVRCIYPFHESFWGGSKEPKRLHQYFEMKIARTCRKYVEANYPAAKR